MNNSTKTVLITGSNRGIGFEFCRQYSEKDWTVLATCRNPDQANELHQLAATCPNVKILRMNVGDFSQIDTLAEQLCDSGIDILINNAGLYGDTNNLGFSALNYQEWRQTLMINTVAPVKVSEAFLPHLKRGKRKLIVNLSSLMGSIVDNQSGRNLVYRSSKAGLNAAMKSIAILLQEQGIGVINFHPGWVKTDMGGANAQVDPQISVEGMLEVIDQFDIKDSGCFVNYLGQPLPW